MSKTSLRYIAVYRNEFVVGHMPFTCRKQYVNLSQFQTRSYAAELSGWSMVWRFYLFIFYLVRYPTSYVQAKFTRLHRLLTREILHIASLWKLALRGHLNTDAQARNRTRNIVLRRTMP